MPALLGALFGSASSTGCATVSSLESAGRRSITPDGVARTARSAGQGETPASTPRSPFSSSSALLPGSKNGQKVGNPVQAQLFPTIAAVTPRVRDVAPAPSIARSHLQFRLCAVATGTTGGL